MVEKCEAVKRECARAEGVGLAEGEARAAKRPQGPAREPQPSEFIQNRADGREGLAAAENLGNLHVPLLLPRAEIMCYNTRKKAEKGM